MSAILFYFTICQNKKNKYEANNIYKMKSKSRISSILNTNSLDPSITGLQTFSLSEVDLASEVDFPLPTNLRLGHLAETVVSGLIRRSTNYKVVYENTQLIENKNTIGEIDFIIEKNNSKQLLHMELAYKFYLYDPTISSDAIRNWIGPNRNDSLIEKIEKIKKKQFPLLYHEIARSKFDNIILEDVSQVLCLLASLYIPYEYQTSVGSSYEKAIKGYYLSMKQFSSFDHSERSYYLPSKLEWGMDPSENENWLEFKEVNVDIKRSINQNQALLCWEKFNDSYLEFFIIWW